MTIEFYGAKDSAQRKINALLGLPATGKEQDWEIELADPSRIEEMINVLSISRLDFDCRAALALLIISSMEEAYESKKLKHSHIQKIYEILSMQKDLYDSMYYYWIVLGRSENIEFLIKLFNKY